MKRILLTLALAVAATFANGQGTLQFANGTLTRFQLDRHDGSARVNVPIDTQLIYGLFWGTSAANVSQTPQSPTGGQNTAATGAGLISVPNGTAYQLPGTNPGDVVFVQIRGWSSSFGSDWQAASRTVGAIYGQTDVRSFTLGPSAGPGTVLWSNSDTTKFRPMLLEVVVPEPSTIALAVLGLGSLLLFRRRK
jgi:hypothetical protein